MLNTDFVGVSRQILLGTALSVVLFGQTAWAGQTVNANAPMSCSNQGGVPETFNRITDFDNGTFGTESGAANQSPSVDPYPAAITGGIFDNFYQFNWGEYGYVANAVTPRNPYQHADITDPVYGATGRFFASDPNADTPTMNFTITNVIPNQNYEISFWAANSEPNGTPNIVNAVVDDIVSYTTGPLPAVPAALAWQKHAFVFNAGNRTTILLAMASTETGSGGRDFYLDNVEMRGCTLSNPGSLTGRVYADSNGNNSYDAGSDGLLGNVEVQLWDTQGDGDPSNDVYISVTSSGPDGTYSFTNLAANSDYELRVDTGDSDLPSGASPGTAITLAASVTPGAENSGNDFGFDISNAFLQANKSVELASGSQYAIPGEDVVYTISVANLGAGSADNNSLFLVDTLPPDVTFYNDDMDGAGTLTSDPVAFAQAGAGLSFNYATDVAFAAAGPRPTSLAACNYTPVGVYDPAVAYICFAPKGVMAGGDPDPSFSLSFRTAIR